jgi:hypothetical protein
VHQGVDCGDDAGGMQQQNDNGNQGKRQMRHSDNSESQGQLAY